MDDTRRLICTVGLPRSGKSTWSRSVGYPMVNPDSIRLALYGQAFIKEAEAMVWTMATYMVKSLFIAGHKIVILDATNLSPGMRLKWINPQWETYWKVFDTDMATCIQRAIDGNRQDLISVIEAFNSNYIPISESELDLTHSLFYSGE